MSNSVRIKSVFISNFRSFAPRKKDDGANVDNLSAINVFVGPNGSGKTNFINALRDRVGWGRFNSKGTCFHEYDSHKGQGDPLEIIIQVEISNSSGRGVSLFGDGQNEITDHSLKEHIYPIGLPHKFSEFNSIHKEEINKGIQDGNNRIKDPSMTTYAKICLAWQKIREDAKRIGIEIQNNYPQEPLIVPNPKDYADRFFYDVVDNYGVPLLEGSDGISNFLLMIVKIRLREPGSVILIEEPEVSMHPRLQKQFLDYLKQLAEKDKYQFLISTHSPYLLNYAVSSETNEVAVFRVFKKNGGCTEIAPVKSNRTSKWEILTDLGHTPADVLQASCIIWVEGPSDRIYLNHWLKAHDPELQEGLHYSIMFYGGRLLNHLSFDDEEINEFIGLRGINQNSIILIDSDQKRKKASCVKQRSGSLENLISALALLGSALGVKSKTTFHQS
jgi:predicted ATPase